MWRALLSPRCLPEWTAHRADRSPDRRSCILFSMNDREENQAKTKRPRILVLDDDKPFRELLVDLFTGAGYEVVTAVTGEDALCKIQEERFDLATIDFDLPGWVNGIDFLKELKETARNTEVILLTGNASEEVAKEAIRCGAYHYYIKPLHQIDQFLHLIGQAIASGRQKEEKADSNAPSTGPS